MKAVTDCCVFALFKEDELRRSVEIMINLSLNTTTAVFPTLMLVPKKLGYGTELKPLSKELSVPIQFFPH